MAEVSMKQLLEAGVHFGHQTSRWNPKMKPYIFGARNGIYIIDLQRTVRLFEQAYAFVRELAANGGMPLMVGTKKQAQDAVREEAERCRKGHAAALSWRSTQALQARIAGGICSGFGGAAR